MEKSFINNLFQTHLQKANLPSPKMVCDTLDSLLGLLFPELSNRDYRSVREFEHDFQALRLKIFQIVELLKQDLPLTPLEVEHAFFERLPAVYALLKQDALAISLGDPAALNETEVIRTYPGFYAIAVYRFAHEFYKLNVPLIPRILTEYAHGKTGVDIHPGAVIGERFCIDHATGIVIGETVEIGNDVKLYQGVTLGALSVRKEMAKVKRHPTIQDRVVIYAGATILGGETVIGSDSLIGGSVWLTKSVPPHSRVYYTGAVKQTRSKLKPLAK